MIDFCPDGYMPLQQALFIAAQFWFPKEVASFETVLENICQEVVRIHQYPQLPDEVRGPFEEIAGQTLPRLRNLLYQGHLKACYFENDGCHSVSREFWATAQAEGVIESGTFCLSGKPARWYDKPPNYSLFVKQSELDALLVDKPTENLLFSSGKKTELAAAYRRPDIEALPTRAAQREAIKKLEPFKPYHITDELFREAEKRSGPRRPGVKRQRQDD
jgi:hypothetical protein